MLMNLPPVCFANRCWVRCVPKAFFCSSTLNRMLIEDHICSSMLGRICTDRYVLHMISIFNTNNGMLMKILKK